MLEKKKIISLPEMLKNGFQKLYFQVFRSEADLTFVRRFFLLFLKTSLKIMMEKEEDWMTTTTKANKFSAII